MNRFERRIAGALGAALIAATIGLACSQTTLPAPMLPIEGQTGAVSDPTGELAAAGLVIRGGDGQLHVDPGTVAEMLEQLEVDDRGTVLEYDRDLFGPSWSDVDHNGCDTRNDILQRDLVDIELKTGTHGCVVLTGTLHDPYTGAIIPFLRGQGTSTEVAIDHRYALAAAWHHGAAAWTPDLRLAFANDPLNLSAVAGGENLSKSSRGPGQWLPDNVAHLCEFVAEYTLVASKYDLSIGSDDKSAIEGVLQGCSAPDVG